MKIYTSNNELFLEPRLSDGFRLKTIMGDNTLTLQYSLGYYKEVPKGAWCTFKNERYFLMSDQQPTKIHDEHFDYKLILDTYIAYLKTQIFEFIELVYENDGSLTITNEPTPEFSLTGRPEDHLRMLCDCMNYNDPERGWTVGEYIDSDEITIDYSHNFCYDVLGMLADRFNTEWEVEGKTIHLRKVEKMKDSAIPLSYGYNKGLVSGITRTTFKEPIGRLVIKTSDRNIDRSKYGSRTLKMPRNFSIMHEGIEYITDSTGTKLQRKVPLIEGILPADSIDLTKIYPRRVGTVTQVIEVDDSKGLYDIIDSTIPEELNFKDMIIPGEKMIVIFQSGQLSGVGGDNGFESGYIHAERKFTLNYINDNGLIYPQGTLIPAVGDKYAVFHISLPQTYISDAQDELLNEALKYFLENEQPQFTYKATLDELYAKRKWGEIGGYLDLGYFVRISEPVFIPEPVDIRIISVKEYVDKEKQPIIEMSNSVTGRSAFASNNNSAQTQSQTNNRIEGNSIEFTKRRFRDAQETMQMLQESLLHFSGAINPITVQTMLLLVGDESLQFRFVDSKTNPVHVPHAITYSNESKRLHADAGILQHMTLGIDSISSSHRPEDYRFWDMVEYISPVLTDPQAKYYVYAKVERSGTSGVFLISETAIEMESEPNYYYLLVGTLNSEFENDRSYVELYGFTEVLPGRITTDRIVSSDGLNFFDFVANHFRLTNNKIGDEEQTLNWENGTLTMTNATINKSLKVLGEALIAGFKFSDQVIKASALVEEQPAMLLDGINGYIKLISGVSGTGGGDGSGGATNKQSTIEISSANGTVTTRNADGVSMVAANGLFSNYAGQQAIPSSTGISAKGAIVGLGFGDMPKDLYSNNDFIAGVIGRANNSNKTPAPAFGGYFESLKVNGLILRMDKISGSTDRNTVLNKTTSLVVSMSSVLQTVTLPNDVYEGTVIQFRQFGGGNIRIQPPSGHVIYDDNTSEDYYEVTQGRLATCIYIGELTFKDEIKGVWTFNRMLW